MSSLNVCFSNLKLIFCMSPQVKNGISQKPMFVFVSNVNNYALQKRNLQSFLLAFCTVFKAI